MDLENEEYFNKLIYCYLTNQASDKNIEELLHWISQSEDNKKQFIELKRTWTLTSQATPKGKFNKAKYGEWRKLSDEFAPSGKKNPKVIASPLQRTIRIAAVFLLLVSVGTTINWIITLQKLNRLENLETVHQINVPKGGRSKVILPDGTAVKLNADSNLSYSGDFGLTNRSVLLEGEGYFEVEANPHIPFVVDALGLKIKALGTTFNVKAYPDEEEIITTLVEGVLEVKGENIDLTMTPAQKVTYIKPHYKQVMPVEEKTRPETKKGISAKKQEIPEKRKIVQEPARVKLANKINTREATAWKDGVYYFNSEKLRDLAVVLERRYDVSIEIKSKDLKDHKFTGTFHQETLEQILNIINLSAPINYEIEKGVVSIVIDKNRESIFKELSHN